MVTGAKQNLKLSRRKRISFYLIYSVSLLLFSAVAAEVVARITGHHPWTVKQVDIKVEPGGRFYQTNPTLGYTHIPGQFKLILNGAYVYKATNLSNTLRITHPLDTYPATGSKKEIWIFGDSLLTDNRSMMKKHFPGYCRRGFPIMKS